MWRDLIFESTGNLRSLIGLRQISRSPFPAGRIHSCSSAECPSTRQRSRRSKRRGSMRMRDEIKSHRTSGARIVVGGEHVLNHGRQFAIQLLERLGLGRERNVVALATQTCPSSSNSTRNTIAVTASSEKSERRALDDHSGFAPLLKSALPVAYFFFHPPRRPGAPPVERGAGGFTTGPNSGPASREEVG